MAQAMCLLPHFVGAGGELADGGAHFFAPIIFAPEKCFLPLNPTADRLKPLPGRTEVFPYGGTAVGRLRAPPVFLLIPYPPPKLCFWNDVFITEIRLSAPAPGLSTTFFSPSPRKARSNAVFDGFHSLYHVGMHGLGLLPVTGTFVPLQI
jgi:hypothetical protein